MFLAVRRVLSSAFGVWMLVGAAACFLLYPPRERLKFGIDLVGGTYITLELDADSLVQSTVSSYTDYALRTLEKDKGIKPDAVKKIGSTVTFTFAHDVDALAFEQELAQVKSFITSARSEKAVTVGLTPARTAQVYKEAISTNVDILRRRLVSTGVEEISVAPAGEKNIVVELPDVHDVAKAKEMIGTPAVLEFKLVESSARSKDELLANYDGEIPMGMLAVPGDRGLWYLVPEYAPVAGGMLETANAGFNQQTHQPMVQFRLKPEGADLFRELTGQNIGKLMAVVLDGRAIQVATIQSEIGAEGMITGMQPEEARKVAMLLQSGAFAGKMNFAEERRIGSSLGKESIHAGLMSCAVGMLLLLVFSIWYYKWAGFFAFLALAYNLLFILVCLYAFGAALTLPGIAGMVLTIGMAIDASILIYEKIKELLAEGASVKHAVEEGFSDAIAVILDSNITTFITGLVLYQFGAGPIKGFALTMMIGILATLITGIFFLRSIFNVIIAKKGIQKLSI
jgi:preprotein translocase subunit SecD